MTKQLKNKLEGMHMQYALRMNIQFFGEDPKKEEKGDIEKNYLEEIEKMKKTMVSKEEYDKAIAENKVLLEKYINGEKPKEKEKEEEKVDVNKECLELLTGDFSNMDYVKKALKIRKQLIKEGKPDPFLPVKHGYDVTEDDRKIADHAAQAYEECLKRAEGDPAKFDFEFSQMLVGKK